MARSNQRQYIHYDSSGFVYHFCLKGTNLTIGLSKENIEYHLMKLEERVLEFAIGIDFVGKFHVASILETGHLKYGIYFDGSWESRSLMTFDKNHSRLKNITLFVFEEKIHLLMAQAYTLNSERWTLKHYYWNKQIWENQKICEVLTDPYDIPFYADMDGKNNIHILYKSRIGKYHQIYYQKYLFLYHNWGIPMKISEEAFEHTHPFILCVEKDNLHITWSTLAKGHYQINYFISKDPLSFKNNLRKEVKVISKKGADCTYPYLMQLDRNIIILWREGIHFFLQKKAENYDQWSAPENLPCSPEKSIVKISILGGTYKEIEPIRIPMAYGYTDGEITVFGIDPLMPYVSDDEIGGPAIDDNERTFATEATKDTDPLFYKDSLEPIKSHETFYECQLLLDKMEELTLLNQRLLKDIEIFMEAHEASQRQIYVELAILQKKIQNMPSRKICFLQKLKGFFQKNDPS